MGLVIITTYIYIDRYGCVPACVFLLNNHKLYDFVTPMLSKTFWLCWEWLPVLCAEQWGILCLDRTSLYIGKLASITLQETSISQLGKRKFIFPTAFGLFWIGYVSSQQGMSLFANHRLCHLSWQSVLVDNDPSRNSPDEWWRKKGKTQVSTYTYILICIRMYITYLIFKMLAYSFIFIIVHIYTCILYSCSYWCTYSMFIYFSASIKIMFSLWFTYSYHIYTYDRIFTYW